MPEKDDLKDVVFDTITDGNRVVYEILRNEVGTITIRDPQQPQSAIRILGASAAKQMAQILQRAANATKYGSVAD